MKYTKRENNFDKNIYDFLKNDYLQTRNKAVSIKNGVKRFGISTKLAKEIVDFAADEVYEENNFRSSDEINDNGNYESKVFKFSFLQYLVRNIVYKIIFLILLFFAGKQVAQMATEYNTRLIFACTLILEAIFIILFLYQLTVAFTQKIIVESGRIIYVYKTPLLASQDDLDRMSTEEIWGMSHMHYINTVNEVIEKPNGILIRGSIKKQKQQYHHLGIVNYKETTVSKISIPKYFRHNRELLQVLKNSI